MAVFRAGRSVPQWLRRRTAGGPSRKKVIHEEGLTDTEPETYAAQLAQMTFATSSGQQLPGCGHNNSSARLVLPRVWKGGNSVLKSSFGVGNVIVEGVREDR